jgi:RNA-directed DNA polymerase
MRQSPSTGRSHVLPPLISFNSAADLKRVVRAAGILSSEADESLFDRLVDAGLPPLISPTVLGLILGVSPKLITALADHPRRKYPYYRRYNVPKKSGGSRTILAPRTYLKAVQKYILRQILEKQLIAPFVTGFVRGRGIVQNAKIHVGARYMLNVDVKDFFPSVRQNQVFGIFRKFGFPNEMSRVLSMICTYEGSLPQGAPTSPYLANLVFLGLDNKILDICTRHNLKYSRYADDLTFSGAEPIDPSVVTRIDSILQPQGFRLNAKKLRFRRPGQAMYVTGLVTNQKVQAGRRTRRLLRAMFHRASEHPREFRKKAANLTGWASYVFSYDRALGLEYLKIARGITPK